MEKSTTYFDRSKVEQGFLKGDVLVKAGDYQVHTARREGPGKPEVHTLETDIFYMLEGEATLVTGGTLLDPVTVEPNEVRGSGIEGGESCRFAKGDVIVIPNGDPHWFKDVKAPITYFVVKVKNSKK